MGLWFFCRLTGHCRQDEVEWFQRWFAFGWDTMLSFVQCLSQHQPELANLVCCHQMWLEKINTILRLPLDYVNNYQLYLCLRRYFPKDLTGHYMELCAPQCSGPITFKIAGPSSTITHNTALTDPGSEFLSPMNIRNIKKKHDANHRNRERDAIVSQFVDIF